MGFRAGKRFHERVLVVDDDPLIQRVSRLTLGRAGIDAVAVGSNGEALAQLGSGRFQVAILDYFLAAGECGCDLIAPLRAHDPSIRIVVVSGLAVLPELIHHALCAGADVIASKVRADWPSLARRPTWPGRTGRRPGRAQARGRPRRTPRPPAQHLRHRALSRHQPHHLAAHAPEAAAARSGGGSG